MSAVSAPGTPGGWRFELADSLEKVWPSAPPRPLNRSIGMSGFLGETLSFQVAFRAPDDAAAVRLRIEVGGRAGRACQIYAVELVPCPLAAPPEHDEHYLATTPGHYPDLLRPAGGGAVTATRGQWRAAWIDVRVDDPAIAGSLRLPVEVSLAETGELLFADELSAQVFPQRLEPLTIVNCHWLHADCLAQYYQVPVFSEEHWALLDQFIAAAGQMDANAVLTPVFTPPLDTEPGSYRVPVQLVDVTVEPGDGKGDGDEQYRFEFSKLARWLALCRRHSISHIEIPHLFTQWGAEFTPAIFAEVAGERRRIFGWETPATDPRYARFLGQFLPALRQFLSRHWDPACVIFHVSDEPEGPDQIGSYRAAREVVRALLAGAKVADALSDLSLVTEGLVPLPVVAVDAIGPFLERGTDPMWAYYCVAQGSHVANRFIALPSVRNRVIGLQLFTFGLQGFLHWGFNFYLTAGATRLIDPFEDTSAGGAFPGGDPFIVYPGDDGPLPSIRYRVLCQAMADHRALTMLAGLKGRAAALAIADPDGSLRFDSFPYDPDHYRRVREKVNAAIASA